MSGLVQVFDPLPKNLPVEIIRVELMDGSLRKDYLAAPSRILVMRRHAAQRAEAYRNLTLSGSGVRIFVGTIVWQEVGAL